MSPDCHRNPYCSGKLPLIGWLIVAVAVGGICQSAASQDVATGQKADQQTTSDRASVTELAAKIKKSLVMVNATGRDGSAYGHGTGFIISENGLIATARHVIGDRRAITVEMPDGTSLPVTKLHATTESIDLVVLQVEASGLTPLPLGDDANGLAGQSVVAVGHPGSMKNSVFSGIISGRQTIAGVPMLQLAMTIEPGSSGEPVVDLDGNVIGLVTLKSTETTNVGFAVPVNLLKSLLKDPTPIPMSRWMTIGALDPARWEVVFGANWRQRASRILVDGTGSGFGGRALCLQTSQPPEIPFEIQVDVKLDDESGAAGLIFHADGNDRHYGFYPSNGSVRLTQFRGPTVYQWKILHNEPHPAYRSADWNTYKVRVEADRMLCYLNGKPVVESNDQTIPPGRVGVATFRGTAASFRRFRVQKTIPSEYPTVEQESSIRRILDGVTADRPASMGVIEQLSPFRRYSTGFLKQQAEDLERKAERFRQLAVEVHAAGIREQIIKASRPDGDTAPDLLRAALLIAVLDNAEIEPDSYIERLDQLAGEVRASLQEDASESERLKALDKLLFEEYGFRGSREEYYTRSNSYLNEVIDDREGLPITLSVLYMELARRLDLNVVGIGLPGHFVVRFEPQTDELEPEIIDVFNRGTRMSQAEAEQLIQARRFPVRPEFFAAQSTESIVIRMLSNLLGLAERKRDNERVLRYLETLVAMSPTSPEYRAKRLEIRARTGRLAEAIEDADWFVDQELEGTDTDRLRQLRENLIQQLERKASPHNENEE